MVETFGPFIRDYIGKYLLFLYPTTKKNRVNINKVCGAIFGTMPKRGSRKKLFSVIFARKEKLRVPVVFILWYWCPVGNEELFPCLLHASPEAVFVPRHGRGLPVVPPTQATIASLSRCRGSNGCFLCYRDSLYRSQQAGEVFFHAGSGGGQTLLQRFLGEAALGQGLFQLGR